MPRPRSPLIATFVGSSERPSPPTPRFRKDRPGKRLRESIEEARRAPGSELTTSNLLILRAGHTRCVYLSLAWIDEFRCLERALIPCPPPLRCDRLAARRRSLTRAASLGMSARF